MLRLVRGAVGGAPTVDRARAVRPAGGLLHGVVEAARRLLGLRPAARAIPGVQDVVFPLRLTRREVEQGGRKRLTLERGDGAAEVLVTIPRGVRPGTRLRLRGQGRPGVGGVRGDAYLVVEVE
jgi:hypothetical protein